MSADEEKSSSKTLKKSKRFLLKAIKDYGWFFLAVYLHGYGYMLYAAGLGYAKFYLYPLIGTFFTGTILWFLFLISIRVFKSKLLFLLFTVLATILNFYSQIHSADNIGLTSRVKGVTYYDHGDITVEGIMPEILDDPFFLSIFFAVFLFFYKTQHSQHKR